MISGGIVIQIFSYLFFFFNDTATTEIYTLSLHDALPILSCQESLSFESQRVLQSVGRHARRTRQGWHDKRTDRKSTRLNSSHANISYAVFCLKKKKIQQIESNTAF